jgi:hypothetical protein
MTMLIGMALYEDESGSIYTMEVVFVTLFMVFGAMAGLISYRDAMSQELGDTAVALDSISQTFTYTLTNDPNDPGDDVTRFFNDATVLVDAPNAAPAGLDLVTPAVAEM